MDTKENTHVLDYLADALRTGADELEKFQVQLSLGKMEALDAYETMKKKYASYTQEIVQKIEDGKEIYQDLIGRLQDLQVQFSLGKAETIEIYEEQRKKILLAIHEVELAIRSNPYYNEANAFLLDMLEKTKVKLEMLSEQFKPVKEQVIAAYEDRKDQVEKVIKEFKEKFNEQSGIEDRIDNFQKEIALAYDHFRKALVG
ncbi:MAG: hypothetical protein ACK5XN_23615 [Bacteroidota bacterium]|jgi:lipopolysaccharide biosynthesis protein